MEREIGSDEDVIYVLSMKQIVHNASYLDVKRRVVLAAHRRFARSTRRCHVEVIHQGTSTSIDEGVFRGA